MKQKISEEIEWVAAVAVCRTAALLQIEFFNLDNFNFHFMESVWKTSLYLQDDNNSAF